MSADRELLELAAKAAGLTLRWLGGACYVQYTREESEMRNGVDGYGWNPRTDAGDALRLAVKLGLNMRPTDDGMTVWAPKGGRSFHCYSAEHGDDPCAAACLAITRAAAEIGKAMT